MTEYKDSLYLQKLVPIDRLLTERHMTRMYSHDAINSQYIMTIFCEEYEKNLYEAYAQKVLMNGQVVQWGDYNEYINVKKQADDLFDIFYNGEKLTSFERDIERKYLARKHDKLQKYGKAKSNRYKVRWTLSDINRFQDQENYRMTDPEYLAKPRPIYSHFSMDESQKHAYTCMDITNMGKIRRTIAWLTEMKIYERSRFRNKLQANIILQKIFQYPDSWEFVNQLSTEEDFHINHSIVNMHIWLVVSRLKDFVKNKFAFDLADDLIDAFNSYARKEIYNLDVMRKDRKIENIENYLFAIRKNFDNHFFINGKTSENPYFKIDALVWSCIYHEKVPRYADKVYRMSEYLIRMNKYIKTLSFEEIEGGNIDWNSCKIPVNYKDRVLKYNIPLSEYEFKREMNSNFKTKKYNYNYRWPEELTEENLKKTFANMITHDKLYGDNERSVRKEHIDFDALQGEDKKEMIFRIKQKLDEYGELPTDKDEFYTDPNAKPSIIQSQFEMWRKSMFIPLSEQLDEQYARKVERQKVEESQKGDKSSVFFQDNITPESYADFGKYKKAYEEARKNQSDLKNTMTTDQLERIERLKVRQEELEKYEKGEPTDINILKRKFKRRYVISDEEKENQLDEQVDDHIKTTGTRRKLRLW